MLRPIALAALALAFVGVVAACSEDLDRTRSRSGISENGKELPNYEDINVKEKEHLPNPFAGLKTGEDSIKALCKRVGALEPSNPNFNAVTNAFCKEGLRPGSIRDLQDAVKLSFGTRDASGTNGSNDNPGFAFLGHSSSLIARNVSAINPRAIVFSAPQGVPTELKGFSVMGFTRGEPFVEIAAQDISGTKITFYVVVFELKCGEDCKPADLFLPSVESNWQNISVYDDEDLKNSIADCRHCHQPGGPGTPMILRMQELEDPWTHWFRSDRPGGLALLQDYARAHGEDEDYGGVPGPIIQKSDGRALEDFVKGQGFAQQPNPFRSDVIEKEVEASSSRQPIVNTPRGESETWNSLYTAAMKGQFIPVPYHDVKVTDPTKLEIATRSYLAVKNGEADEMLDIRRVFLEDALEAMTFRSKKGASGKEILVQTCAQCHNPSLDQDISRAKFDVTKMGSMSRKAKDEAIARLEASSSDIRKMPPAMMRSLTDEARAKAIAYLKQ